MELSTCECGNVFPASGTRPPRLYCDDCRQTRKKKYSEGKDWAGTSRIRCAECNLWFNRSLVSVERTCAPCRRGEPAVHGLAATYNRGCLCDPCREVGTAQERAGRARGTVKSHNKKITVYCIACGTAFVAWPRTKYCSKECRGWDYGNGTSAGGGHRHRARHHGVAYERFTREEIFERDGWICGVCHDPVDKNLKWPDHMSVSLDHIIPMSRGGGHVPSNTQCTHLICNIRKRCSMPAAT